MTYDNIKILYCMYTKLVGRPDFSLYHSLTPTPPQYVYNTYRYDVRKTIYTQIRTLHRLIIVLFRIQLVYSSS